MVAPVRMETFGPLLCRVAGGEDGEGGGDGPVVILLHGYGASGGDLVPFHQVLGLPPAVRWVFPAAPLELPSMFPGMDSRAWWNIDVAALERAMRAGETRDLARQVPKGLEEAREAVLAMLEAVDGALSPSARVLGGFSQGSMVSMDVALHGALDLAGLVLLSSTLIAEPVWLPRMASRAGLRVFQSHGEGDPLLSFAAAERLRDHLTEAGLDVDWVSFRGGHDIPAPVLGRLQAFLGEVLALP